MNRFALSELTTVTVEHINIGDENHGDEKVTRVDLKLSKEMNNAVLEDFKPGLRKLLYFKSKTPREPVQGALELEEPNELPDLRFPELGVLKWAGDQEGCTLTLDYGLGGKSSVRLTDCKANEWRLECKEGGTVKVTWRIQRVQPDKRAVGELSGMLKHDVQAMLTASPETLALLEGQGTSDAGDEPTAPVRKLRKVEATDAFIAQHGAGASDGAAV